MDQYLKWLEWVESGAGLFSVWYDKFKSTNEQNHFDTCIMDRPQYGWRLRRRQRGIIATHSFTAVNEVAQGTMLMVGSS